MFYLTVAGSVSNSASAQGFLIEGNSLSDRVFNSDEVPGDDIFALDFSVTNGGPLHSILTWGETSGGGPSGLGETFYAYVLRPAGSNYQVMAESGLLTVSNVGTNVFAGPAFALEPGDWIGHYGRGIPLSTGTDGPSIVFFSPSVLPMPSVGQVLELPGPSYPSYNDGGRNYAIAVGVGGPPELNIAKSGGSVIVFWAAVGTNTLLQTTDLTSGTWTTNTSYFLGNGTNFLSITPPAGNLFFCLRSP
jgi:hypothetical protein